MLGSLVLLTLAPAAPAPKDPPPPVEVTVNRYAPAPRLIVGGRASLINVDDGHFIEVTIKNTSKEAVSFDSRHELGDLVHVKVTNEKGTEVSRFGYHLELACSSKSRKNELLPGESATVIAHLMQDWLHEAESRKTGKYTARVVFAFEKIKARSAATFEWEYVN